MIILTEQNIIELRKLNLEYLVVSNKYLYFSSFYGVDIELVDEALVAIGANTTYQELLDKGYLADLEGFVSYLHGCNIYKAALKAGQTNQAIRKLVFELTFWTTHEVGKASPNTILAVWNELNALSRGSIKSSVTSLDRQLWNEACDQYRLHSAFKL